MGQKVLYQDRKRGKVNSKRSFIQGEGKNFYYSTIIEINLHNCNKKESILLQVYITVTDSHDITRARSSTPFATYTSSSFIYSNMLKKVKLYTLFNCIKKHNRFV